MPAWAETLIQSGIAGAVVVLLGRAIVDRWLGHDLEEHKAALQTESQKEIDELRSRLEREAHEHQIRFSTLHETRAEVVAEIYGKLERMHMAYRRMTAMIQPGNVDIEELRDDARKSHNDFAEYYYPHAIWLRRDTCDSINEILEEFRGTFFDFGFDLNEQGYPRNREAWENARTAIEEQVPEMRTLLERRFREILGVELVDDEEDQD